MLPRLLPLGFCLAGLVLLGLGTWGYWQQHGRPGVTVDCQDVEVATAGPEQESVAVFWLTNPTSRLARVIGLEEC
jgi:hypothetical protein